MDFAETVIYHMIDAAIYDVISQATPFNTLKINGCGFQYYIIVLYTSYMYPDNDMETALFDQVMSPQ